MIAWNKNDDAAKCDECGRLTKKIIVFDKVALCTHCLHSTAAMLDDEGWEAPVLQAAAGAPEQAELPGITDSRSVNGFDCPTTPGR